MVIAWTQPVLRHECCNTERIKPVGDLASFMIRCQHAVAAAGEYDHRRPRSGRIQWQIDREGWLVAVLIPQCSTSAIFPQQNRLRLSNQIEMICLLSSPLSVACRGQGQADDRDEKMFHCCRWPTLTATVFPATPASTAEERSSLTAFGSLSACAARRLTCHISVSESDWWKLGIPVRRIPFDTFQ